jgi:hypothetical protein
LILLLKQVVGLFEPFQAVEDFVVGVSLCVILHSRHKQQHGVATSA